MFSSTIECVIPSSKFTTSKDGLIFLDMNKIIKMKPNLNDISNFTEDTT